MKVHTTIVMSTIASLDVTTLAMLFFSHLRSIKIDLRISNKVCAL